MWKTWNPRTLVVEMQNGAVNMENILAVQKAKHRITTWPSHSTPRYGIQFKRIKNRNSNRDLYTIIH